MLINVAAIKNSWQTIPTALHAATRRSDREVDAERRIYRNARAVATTVATNAAIKPRPNAGAAHIALARPPVSAKIQRTA